MNGLLTEIRTFYSLKEIRESMEAEINQFRMLLEDYSEWLGTLLRNPESPKEKEWVKKAAELQKIMKAGSRKREKKKGGEFSSSTEWVQFKDLLICSETFGEAEILFEVVEELREKIDRLEKVRNSLADLERYGLGKDVQYIAYIKDGVPEKIVFKHREGSEASEKFKFTADFSITKQT